MKSVILTFLLIILFPFISNAQIKEIIIFKWETSFDGNQKMKRVVIDSVGNVLLDSKNVGNLNVQTLTDDVNKLIKEKRLTKSNPNNDLPEEISSPENGTQKLFVNIFMLEDSQQQQDYLNPSTYLWNEVHPIDTKEYIFYKYFEKKNLDIIKPYVSN